MTTEDTTLDSALTTADEALLSPSDTELSQETTEDTEDLKAKLAAAESEAKMWKGRVEKATKTGKTVTPSAVSEEDLDWKIMNSSRISLVKEAYQKELEELQSSGAKLTNELRDKALKYVEAQSGISKATTVAKDDLLPQAGVLRSGSAEPKLTNHDVAFKVKPETVKEYRDYVEGR